MFTDIVFKIRYKQHKRRSLRMTSLKITILALYTGLVFAMQLALSFLPNIEVVTFLLAMAALIFTWYYAVAIAIIFTFLEVMIAGSGVWAITYFVVWPALCIIVASLKKVINKHWWVFVIINAFFGFAFGSFDTGIDCLFYGTKTAMAYWMAGWVFDAVHGISNFIVAFILYKPIKGLFDKTLKKYLF